MSQKISLPKFFITLLCFALIFFQYETARAQSLIRDTEIENIFRVWMDPLLKAADIGPNSVNLIVVNSPQINAFVAGGANIFIFTGLIERSEGPEEIIGVLAHELGHIAGGHLIGGRDALERASFESILGAVLGIGAAVATGNGQVASAIISGSNQIATRRYLAHSRVNESSADQAALRFIEQAQINPSGLKSFLKKLESEELMPRSDQSEYVRTHPINSERIAALENKINNSPYKDKAIPALWREQHARMKAKLLGYIDPGRVLWTYNDKDQSIAANYARTIAAYRQSKFEDAMAMVNALIQSEPDNPYFHELKGDILLSAGHSDAALSDLRIAVEGTPNASLIRIQLGKALLQLDQTEENLNQAVEILQRALIDEPRSVTAHRLLATAYGRLEQENMAKLHLAEEAVLQGKYPYAKTMLASIKDEFEENSRPWLKTRDLLFYIENIKGQNK